VRSAARANHALLYAMLMAQPVIGFLDTNAWGVPGHLGSAGAHSVADWPRRSDRPVADGDA
jgi:hypothetical protein